MSLEYSEELDLTSARHALDKCLTLYSTRFRQNTIDAVSENTQPSQVMLEMLIQDLKRIAYTVEHCAVFSSNEEIDDVKTEDISFILIPFLLGELASHGSNIKNRLVHLQHAVVGESLVHAIYWKQFLHSCDALKLFLPDQHKRWLCDAPANEHIKRQDKIASYHRQKELDTKITSLTQRKAQRLKQQSQSIDMSWDDETERELRITYIQRSIDEVLDHMGLVLLEIQMQESLENEKPKREAPKEKLLPKPFLYKITNVTEIRNLYRKKVFEPFYDLPTVSLDEVARQEMEREVHYLGSKERAKQQHKEEKQKAVEQGLDVSSDASDDTANEARELEEREWDNWKDDHPRGSGNKMRNVG